MSKMDKEIASYMKAMKKQELEEKDLKAKLKENDDFKKKYDELRKKEPKIKTVNQNWCSIM